MSLPLFILTIKKNWGLLLIFFAVLTMYTTIMIYMFNPDDMEGLMSVMNMLPEDLIRAMGFASVFTDLTGYLASWLYGMLMTAFPIVYSIILGNRLVTKTVDSGSITCLLSTPNSRVKIILTKGIYAFFSLAVLQFAVMIIGIVVSSIAFPDMLDIKAFFALNFTTLLVNMTVMAIMYFSSCYFSDSKYSLGFGAGIPIMFLLFNMLGGASKDISILKNISIFGWYNPVELVYGENYLFVNIIYIVIILLLFGFGTLIFKNKRLTI